MASRVTVKISGPAFRVTAYVVNSKILKQLQSATEDDALYEDEPLSIVGNIALRAIRVANGFCIDNVDDFKFEVRIDGEFQEVEKVGLLYEGCEFDDEFDSELEKTLLARSENSEPVGEDFSAKAGQMLVLEFEDIKLAELTCSFDVSSQIGLKDIELGLVDLDVVSEMSQATYELGLINGLEKDIRYIIFNGEKHEFDIDVLSSYASSFVLVKRNKSGEWVQEAL
jgi:hypothetical protein